MYAVCLITTLFKFQHKNINTTFCSIVVYFYEMSTCDQYKLLLAKKVKDLAFCIGGKFYKEKQINAENSHIPVSGLFRIYAVIIKKSWWWLIKYICLNLQ